MTTKLLLAVKKWAFPILIVYALTLTVFSLVRLEDIPSLGFFFDDKIYHCLAYLVFTYLAYNFFSQKKLIYALFVSTLSVIVFGIIIEVLQLMLTSYRTLDVYDVIANTVGALVAALILRFLNNTKLK